MASSSSVCQGLQSHLDPLTFEPREIPFLTHQLAPPKQDLSFSNPKKQNDNSHSEAQKNCLIEIKGFENNKNGEKPICSTKSLSQTPRSSNNPEQVYVHPLDKSSSYSLTSRSLEMCTESLGNETGSDILMDESWYILLETKKSCSGTKPPKIRKSPKKMKCTRSFPPPLTSVRGGVQLRAHREGGRLVIKAFHDISFCRNNFEVERENGRLRLYLNKNECSEIEPDKNCDDERGKESDLDGCLWREKRLEIGGGGEWWCSGDGGGGKWLPSLPFCEAIS